MSRSYKTKLDDLSRTLHFLKSKAKKRGFRSFEEYVAHQIIEDNDKNLLYRIVDKWLPSKQHIQQSVDPQSVERLENVLDKILEIEKTRQSSASPSSHHAGSIQSTDKNCPVDAEFKELNNDGQCG